LDAIPNANSVTGMVTLKTYNGSTLLDKTSKTITVKVPATATPLITCSAPVHVRGIVPEAWGKYVKGKSKVSLSGTTTARYGSSIASVVIGGDASGSATIAGNTFTFTSGYLSRLDVNTFTVAVTDSRGKKSTATFNTITVQDYFLPGIESPSIFRCTSAGTASDSGTYIYVKGTFRFASVDSKNSVTGKAYYRQMPSGSWLPAGGVAISSGEYALLGDDALSEKSSYQAKIVIQDGLYPGVAATEYVEDIGTAGCLFDAYKKERFALFKYAEYDGFEVGQDKEIRYKGETLDQRFVQKISGSYLSSPMLLAAQTNLNNIMTPGMYYCPANVTVATFTNCPTTNALALMVERAAGYIQTIKEYMTSGAKTYIRRYYNGSWGAWVQVWDNNITIPLSGGGTGATDKATAKTNLGFSSGTGSPSGGVDGDVYFKYV
jgi:hypothetical protein